MTRATVLFVCSGNQYRSVLAERLFAARLGAYAELFRIGSAGTVAFPGVAMPARTAEIIAGLGGNTGGFTTRRLTEDLVASADVVLGLAREHREAAVRLCPTALRRCFVLEEFVRLIQDDAIGGGLPEVVARAADARGRWPRAVSEADDIADPDGAPEPALHACAVRIDQAVGRAAAVLAGGLRGGG
jgi:protein-tyrosine phosphatase